MDRFGKAISFSCKDIVLSIGNALGRLPSAARIRKDTNITGAVEAIEKRSIEIHNFAEAILCRDVERLKELEAMSMELATHKSLSDLAQEKIDAAEQARIKAEVERDRLIGERDGLAGERDNALKLLAERTEKLQQANGALEAKSEEMKRTILADVSRIHWFGERLHATYEHGILSVYSDARRSPFSV